MSQRKTRLTAADIKGAWAIIPTPATPNASDWRATNTVDLDETARVVEAMIASGIDGILSLGTLGECATLNWEEKRSFIATMVEIARGRVPIFAGTSSLNPRQKILETRGAFDLGADGTMIGPPMCGIRLNAIGWANVSYLCSAPCKWACVPASRSR